MIRTNVYQTTDVRKLTLQKGCFSVLEYDRDISVGPGSAQSAYFAAKMGLKRRQLLAGLNGNGIIMQAGAMQIISGNIQAGTNVKGVGDFFKKAISAKVTNESAIKPHYTGYGTILFEPTYKYILLVDLSEWGGFVDRGRTVPCRNGFSQSQCYGAFQCLLCPAGRRRSVQYRAERNRNCRA